MTVRYSMRHGHPVPDYVCQKESIKTAGRPCQVITGTGLDDAVSEVILDAVSPASLDVALQVFEEIGRRRAELDRIRRARVERVREEAEFARRQYMLVRPENRLVADSLERQWNEKLALLNQAEEEYRKAKEETTECTADERKRIQALAQDLPRVWKDARTSARDKKRMLRLLVEDVTLTRRAPLVQIDIRWKGGATTTVTRPLAPVWPDLVRTPSSVVEMVRALVSRETDRQIAQTLNARDLHSGKGRPFAPNIIKHIRATYGIDSMREQYRKQGWLTSEEMAAQLKVDPKTARRFAQEGLLRAVKVNDKGDVLFAPITGLLPKPQPGVRFQDRRLQETMPHLSNEVQYEA